MLMLKGGCCPGGLPGNLAYFRGGLLKAQPFPFPWPCPFLSMADVLAASPGIVGTFALLRALPLPLP